MKSRLATIRTVFFLSAALLVGGCATSPPLGTPSGRPEVTIRNATKKQVIDTIVSHKLHRGATITAVTDYEVIASEVVSTNLGATLLFGSRYDPNPRAQIRYNVVEVPSGIRVFSTAEMITNPGSAFQRVTPVTEGTKQQLYADLLQLKAIFDGPVPRAQQNPALP